MKKAVIAALSICCLMGAATASAAEVQVRTEKTVSAAVSATEQAQHEEQTQKQYIPAKTAAHHEGSLKDRVHAILNNQESAPSEVTTGEEKYHYAESTHEATVVTPWNRQKYEDQYEYQYQHDSYDAAIANAYAYRRDFGKSNLRKWSSTEGMDTPWDSNHTTDTVSFSRARPFAFFGSAEHGSPSGRHFPSSSPAALKAGTMPADSIPMKMAIKSISPMTASTRAVRLMKSFLRP